MGLLDSLTGAMNSPLTHAGLGLLNANQKRMAYDPAQLPSSGWGAGLLGGMNSYNAYQAQQAKQAQQAAIAEAKRQELLLKQQEASREAAERRQLLQVAGTLPEPYRSAARAGPEAAQEAVKAYMAAQKPKQFAPPTDQALTQWLLKASPEERAEYEAMKEANARRSALAAASSPSGRLAQSMAGTQHELAQVRLQAERNKAKKTEEDSLLGRQKAMAKYRVDYQDAQDTLRQVDNALGVVNWKSTGWTGEVLKKLPATDADVLQGRLRTIKSKIVRDTLKQMRSLSPTGASGMGALSQTELELLEASIADLRTSTGEAEIINNLGQVRTHYSKLMGYIAQDRAEQEEIYAKSRGAPPSGGLLAPKSATSPSRKRIRYDLQGNKIQ